MGADELQLIAIEKEPTELIQVELVKEKLTDPSPMIAVGVAAQELNVS